MRITDERTYLPLWRLVPISNGPVNKGEFTDVCSPFSGSYFPIVVNPTQVAWGLETIPYFFPCLSPLYALNIAHMRAIFLRCANDSQSKPPAWCTNLAAFFFGTRSKECIWHSLYGSQHAAPYSRIGRTSDLYATLFVCLFPFFKKNALQNVVPSRLFEPYYLPLILSCNFSITTLRENH
jgi:hypothetical protein